MRILIILPSLHMGGGEKFAVDLANELAKDKNNQVVLAVLSKISKNMILQQNISDNISIVSFNKNVGFDYKILFKLKKFLKDNKFDIVHTHLRSMLYTSWSILSMRNIKFIHTFHTLIQEEVKSLMYKYMLKVFFTYLNVTPVAINLTVKEGLKKFFNIEKPNMILNGVSQLKVSKDFKKVEQEIARLKNDKHTKVFINVARVTKVKNQKLLIETFQKLHSNAILIIIGSLTNEITYAHECQTLVKNINNVFFLGEKNNVADYLESADALCLSSIYEGLPLVILEAMSLGKPTLSTNIGGIPDVIQNNINGYLSKDMSSDAYLKILNQFMQNSNLDQKKIYSIFEKNYSISICKQHYYNLYQTILKEEKL